MKGSPDNRTCVLRKATTDTKTFPSETVARSRLAGINARTLDKGMRYDTYMTSCIVRSTENFGMSFMGSQKGRAVNNQGMMSIS